MESFNATYYAVSFQTCGKSRNIINKTTAVWIIYSLQAFGTTRFMWMSGTAYANASACTWRSKYLHIIEGAGYRYNSILHHENTLYQ